MFKIGEMSKRLGVSIDTLRYYEKIGLLPRIYRKATGLRLYDNNDVSRVEFIKRSQSMKFSLDEIKLLLQFRDTPQKAKADIRQLTARKLKEIDKQLEDLTLLKSELHRLFTLCTKEEGKCPILNAMDGNED